MAGAFFLCCRLQPSFRKLTSTIEHQPSTVLAKASPKKHHPLIVIGSGFSPSDTKANRNGKLRNGNHLPGNFAASEQ